MHVDYLARQRGVTPKSLDDYDWTDRTGRRDRAEILNFLGIRRAHQQDKDALVAWLRAEILPAAPLLESLLEQAHDWFARQKIEPPWKKHMNVVNFRALSPLICAHVNPYGRFELDMNARLSIEAKTA